MRSRPFSSAALALAAAGVALWSEREPGRSRDAAGFHSLNSMHSPARDRFFSGITELGSIWAAAGAAAAMAILGRRRAAARAFAAAGVTWTLGQVLKKAVLRPRPYHRYPESARVKTAKPRGTSWPSSHPAVLMTFVTVAGRELGLSAGSRALLGAAAGTVGVSRTYLGVHYPSDVAGGLLIGRAVGLAWPGADRG